MFINKSAKLLSSKTEMLSFSSCLLHWTLFGGGTTVPATLLLFGTLQRTQCIIILWSQQRPSIEWQTGTNRWFSWWRPMTTSTRMLWEFSFLFRFVFPHENSKTIGANYLIKENGQSILVLVVIWRHHENRLFPIPQCSHWTTHTFQAIQCCLFLQWWN